jgi:hypothetical protein
MTGDQLKAKVVKWAKQIGRDEALFRLVSTRACKPSTAEKLIAGTYESNPKQALERMLLEEMAKDMADLGDKAS